MEKKWKTKKKINKKLKNMLKKVEHLKKKCQFVTICYDVVTTSAQGALVVTIRYDS